MIRVAPTVPICTGGEEQPRKSEVAPKNKSTPTWSYRPLHQGPGCTSVDRSQADFVPILLYISQGSVSCIAQLSHGCTSSKRIAAPRPENGGRYCAMQHATHEHATTTGSTCRSSLDLSPLGLSSPQRPSPKWCPSWYPHSV